MTQTTGEAGAASGPTNERAEKSPARNARGQEQGGQQGATRHRPSRRSHGASKAKAAEASATPATTPETITEPPAAVAAAPAKETTTEPRKLAARGASKRPAARKGGAQLIISRQQAEAEAAASEQAPAATGVTEPAAPAAEPTIVPVLSPSAPETPVVRKFRFGQSRRFPTPGGAVTAAEPAGPVAVAEEAPAMVSAPAEEAVEAPVMEAPEEAPAEAPRRYRFDRSRLAVRPGNAAPATRPERVSAPAAGLYTAPSAPAEVAEPEAAPENALGLPSLDELAQHARAAEPGGSLPPLTFAAHAASSAPAASPDVIAEAQDERQDEEHDEGAEDEAGGAGGRRRRRRRRGSSVRNGAHAEDAELAAGADADEAQEEGEAEPYQAYPPYQEAPDAFAQSGQDVYQEPEPEIRRRGRFGRTSYGARPERQAPAEPGWDAEPQRPAALAEPTPYAGPEPSFARGFGPAPRGQATSLRETYPRVGRAERGVAGATDGASSAQLGSVIREAINAQTDRLLNELRRQQTPPALTFSLPAMPSTERVGVFVDVANLFYSARALRVNIDFGQLLDFLRGNRRLARAHAYAPTNPEPGADQAFLTSVKGLGYRITTKNYKTFSSGAKKADLDLDLCMDIVRLVDAKALDTVVLVSGDSDFLPLLDYCGDHGVRVEVAAFDDSASMILRQSCDLFINLSLVEAIRG